MCLVEAIYFIGKPISHKSSELQMLVSTPSFGSFFTAIDRKVQEEQTCKALFTVQFLLRQMNAKCYIDILEKSSLMLVFE